MKDAIQQLYEEEFPLHFNSRNLMVIEPEYLAAQYKRVKAGDRGAALTLLLDDFPIRGKAIPFTIKLKGSILLEFVDHPSEERGWEFVSSGTTMLESGSFSVLDQQTAVDALAVWRNRNLILEQIQPNWSIGRGIYTFLIWQHKRERALQCRIEQSSGQEGGGEQDYDDSFNDKPIVMNIEDELDLHTFPPAEAKVVLEEYLKAASGKGFREVRIVHGKGIGEIRRLTHKVLKRSAVVVRYYDAPPQRGGLGATIVELKK